MEASTRGLSFMERFNRTFPELNYEPFEVYQKRQYELEQKIRKQEEEDRIARNKIEQQERDAERARSKIDTVIK